jgi:4-azaleucine resistance transporter AzlC
MPRTRHHITAALRAAFPVSLPVFAGYIFLGAGYGVLMDTIGYGPLWTGLLSVMILGGTIQYVATTLLVLDFAPVNALVVSLMLNARHLFYGFSMLERYSGAGWKKPFLVFWLTDETFSLVCSDDIPPGVDKNWFRFFVSGLNYCYWIAGGLLGNVASEIFAFDSRGIEFVMTALFTVIVTQQWREGGDKLPALIGFAASAACVWLFGPGMFVIPAMAGIAALLLVFRKRIQPPPGDRA